jgi:hypothetical protein
MTADGPKCQVCSAPLGTTAWHIGMLDRLCQPCAERIEACQHDVGDQAQRYDADGCGYRVWQCAVCRGEWHDPY